MLTTANVIGVVFTRNWRTWLVGREYQLGTGVAHELHKRGLVEYVASNKTNSSNSTGDGADNINAGEKATRDTGKRHRPR